MSDERLRNLERRWKETGSVEDEAAFLLERVRAGDLTQERLELAAYCGLEGARAAVPGYSDPWPPVDGQIWAWTEGVGAWGDVTLARAGVAALRLAEGFWNRRRPGDPRFRAAVEVAERWIAGIGHDREVAETALAAEAAFDEANKPECDLAWAAAILARAPEDLQKGACEAAYAADEILEGVPEAIAGELTSWALGHRDPVLERLDESYRVRSSPPRNE